MAWVTVQDFQRGVLHESGRAPVVLGAGRRWYRKRRSALTVVDLRPAARTASTWPPSWRSVTWWRPAPPRS